VRLVLDQAAVHALGVPGSVHRRQVVNAMKAAVRLRRETVVPTVVLAELYRGGGHNQFVDALLSREEESIVLRDTDRALARFVGAVLSAADAGSEHMVDAHVVAVAVENGGGVIVTGDPDDLQRLADPFRAVAVDPLRAS
jgi:predicted nucleic acid-binding protein